MQYARCFPFPFFFSASVNFECSILCIFFKMYSIVKCMEVFVSYIEILMGASQAKFWLSLDKNLN